MAGAASHQESDFAQGRVALVTGANTGIGKDIARQLALSGTYAKVILACRNPAKAERAKGELESATGKPVFEIVVMDLSDAASVRAALKSLSGPIDDLVMNAGGSGGKTPLALTRDGVTQIFASNVLGHVILLDELIRSGRLKRAAVFAGSEAARGIPKLGMKRPALKTSSADEFASLCDGSFFPGPQARRHAGLWAGEVSRCPVDGRHRPTTPESAAHHHESRQHERHRRAA